MANRLAGKVALITGGSRGLGRGIAEGFAGEGASIIVNYIKDAASARSSASNRDMSGGYLRPVYAPETGEGVRRTPHLRRPGPGARRFRGPRGARPDPC